MKNKFMILFVVFISLSMTSCAGVGGYTQPAGLFPAGILFTDSVSGSQMMKNGVAATKEGKACGTYIVAIGTGDTTLETAMKNGGITELVFVSQSVKSILGFIYGEVCTIARGN